MHAHTSLPHESTDQPRTRKRSHRVARTPTWKPRAQRASTLGKLGVARANIAIIAARPVLLMRYVLAASMICLVLGGLGFLAGMSWAGQAIAIGVTAFIALIAIGSSLESNAIRNARHLAMTRMHR